jgi:hypothetical protein
MSLPTPNWITDEEIIIPVGSSVKALPAHSFVRPISYIYLPSYIKQIEEDKSLYLKMDPDKEIYCYTRYGIVLLPWKRLRKV